MKEVVCPDDFSNVDICICRKYNGARSDIFGVRKTRHTFYQRRGKRLFDLLLAVPACILAAPLIAIIAVLVRVFIGTPVFFRQKRPGLGGRPFELIKFRTMTDTRDDAGQLLPDAHRSTRLGRLLRKTSLDELPELWNILRGDMSLVGPRPLLMEYLPYYSPRENTRHDVRPGLTGYAQANGRNYLLWDQRLEMDAKYAESLTFVLDLRIIAKTAGQVVRASGVKEVPGGIQKPLHLERSHASSNSTSACVDQPAD
jgi:lipopolysaccharide/colanic/teichoic acid biosynthesis glycosyltransferase